MIFLTSWGDTHVSRGWFSGWSVWTSCSLEKMICVIQKNLFIVQIFDRNKSIQQFRIDLRNCWIVISFQRTLTFTLLDFWIPSSNFLKNIYTIKSYNRGSRYKRYLQSRDTSSKSSFRFFFYIDLLHFSRIKMDHIHVLQRYFVIYKILYTDIYIQTVSKFHLSGFVFSFSKMIFDLFIVHNGKYNGEFFRLNRHKIENLYMIRCVMGLEKCTKKFFSLKTIKSFIKYYRTKGLIFLENHRESDSRYQLKNKEENHVPRLVKIYANNEKNFWYDPTCRGYILSKIASSTARRVDESRIWEEIRRILFTSSILQSFFDAFGLDLIALGPSFLVEPIILHRDGSKSAFEWGENDHRNLYTALMSNNRNLLEARPVSNSYLVRNDRT